MSFTATILCFLFIWWLCWRDRELRGTCSTALWIPVLWIVVIGSRPVSTWFGFDTTVADIDLEGSPVDRLVFLGLMLAAFAILCLRRVKWRKVLSGNRWLCLYLIYLGISAVWADHPFVSFKRWVKDCGNVCMVLVVLSEADPVEAVKSLLFRCASILLPVSVLLIKYYPNLGRYYDQWTWQYRYGGITTDKNMLGMSLFLCGMGLSWGLIDLGRRRSAHWKDVSAYLILAAMCLWLWSKADSATSLLCTIIGGSLLLGVKLPAVRNFMQRMGILGLLSLLLLVLVLNALFNPTEMVAGVLGRNLTLTGRTDIWQEVLRVHMNPAIGTGYCSFWDGTRGDEVSKALGFFFRLKEAHNGYLDVYLNGGLVGLVLIGVVLAASANRAIRGLRSGGSYASFRFAVLASAMIYNLTESAFCGLVTLWIALLLVIVECPRPKTVARAKRPARFATDPSKLVDRPLVASLGAT